MWNWVRVTRGMFVAGMLVAGTSPRCFEPASTLPRRMSSGQGCQGWDPAASAKRPISGPNRPGLLQLSSTDSPAWTHTK